MLQLPSNPSSKLPTGDPGLNFTTGEFHCECVCGGGGGDCPTYWLARVFTIGLMMGNVGICIDIFIRKDLQKRYQQIFIIWWPCCCCDVRSPVWCMLVCLSVDHWALSFIGRWVCIESYMWSVACTEVHMYSMWSMVCKEVYMYVECGLYRGVHTCGVWLVQRCTYMLSVACTEVYIRTYGVWLVQRCTCM